MKLQNKLKSKLIITLAISVLLLLAACGQKENNAQTSNQNNTPEQKPEVVKQVEQNNDAASQFPKTLLVEGETVTIPDMPKRIAALSLDAAEAVLELVDPDRVAVLPRSSEDPALAYQFDKAKKVENKIASATSLDPEEILSYDSDLLIMTKIHDSEKDADQILRDAGLPILSLKAWNTLENVWANYELIGQAVGEEEKAKQIVEEMKTKIDSIQQAIAGEEKPTLLVISPLGPGTGPYFIGSSNISYDITRMAGAHNAADDLGLTRVTKASIEQIINSDPEYILLIQWKEGDTADLEEITDTPGWDTLQAVQKGNVKMMTVKTMFYPNRYNADSIAEIAQWLHPNQFK